MTFEKWIQSRLTAHGFPVGAIDGKIGPVTLKALLAFQRRHELPDTGKADTATVKALRASSTAVTPKEAGLLMPNRDQVREGEPPSRDDALGPMLSRWPRQKDVRGIFGGVGERQTIVRLPFNMVLAWDTGRPVRQFSCHELVAPAIVAAMEEIAELYSEEERRKIGIDKFGGCLNVRKMRGGSSYSMHSWGIAIDFDPERNQLRWGRDRARLAQDDAVPFWLAWEKQGFISLGRERNFDWMHVQAARL